MLYAHKIAGGRSRRRGKRLLSLAGDVEGLALTEFALVVGAVSFALLSTVDVARYYHAKSEVENATQMAVQSAWGKCDATTVPVTTNCPAFMTSVNAGLRSTSLGANVILKPTFPSEAYYCLNAAGDLQSVGSSKPVDCKGVIGSTSTVPVDYVQIQTSYVYRPLFSGISVGSLLPTTITSTSMMRME